MFLTFKVILCMSICIFVVAFDREFQHIGNADNICDQVVSELFSQQEVLDQVSPVHVPDIKHGKLETKNGLLYGLDSARRMGHCSYDLGYIDNDGVKDDTVFALVNAGVENLTFSMDYKIKLLFFNVDGHIEGRVDLITVDATASFNEKDNIHMNSFNVTRFDKIEVTKVSAIIPQSSFILKTIVNVIVKDKKAQIISALETAVVDLINEKIEKFKLE